MRNVSHRTAAARTALGLFAFARAPRPVGFFFHMYHYEYVISFHSREFQRDLYTRRQQLRYLHAATPYLLLERKKAREKKNQKTKPRAIRYSQTSTNDTAVCAASLFLSFFERFIPHWINEWINEWTNEWINEWTNEWTDEWINEWINVWINEWINEWINGPMNGSMNGPMDQTVYSPG